MLETSKPQRNPAPRLPALGAVLLCGLAALFQPSTAKAQDDALMAELARLKVVREGGRELVEVKLRDVLGFALERSTVVKAARIGERVAERALAAAQARNNPTLTNTLTQSRSLSASSSGDPANLATLVGIDAGTLSSEFAKKLDNGVSWSLKLSEAQTGGDVLTIENAGDDPTTASITSRSTTSLTASVTVPLFQDFGSELGTLPVRRGELGLSRSRYLTRQEADSVLRTIALVYWNLVAVLENIRVQEESVKLSEQLLRDNQERLRAGVLSPADVKVAETQLALDRQTLLELQNEALRIEDQARAALNLETLTMGLKPVDVPSVRALELSTGALREKTFQHDPNLGLLENALKDNSYQLLEARNKEKTNLDFNLSYTFNGYDDSTFGGVSGLSDTNLSGYGATLTWTVPLFDRQAFETTQQRLLERSQIELRVRDLKSALSIRVQSETRSLGLKRREVETAGVSVSLAEELLQNEIERFKLGRSTSFQVAQSQRDLARARQREIFSRVQFENTLLEILVLTGDIYSFYDLPEPPVSQTYQAEK